MLVASLFVTFIATKVVGKMVFRFVLRSRESRELLVEARAFRKFWPCEVRAVVTSHAAYRLHKLVSVLCRWSKSPF